MNIGEIAERLIQAAEIDRHSRVHVGPAQARSLPLPYAFDQADKNGWGSERLAEDRAEFFDSMAKQPTARQVSEAEEAWSWVRLIPDASQRQALLAWVRAQAGGRYFNDWCFKHGIHPETGRRRKDRALASISANLRGRPIQNNEMRVQGVLLETPSETYFGATFQALPPKRDRITGWRADPSLRLITDPEAQDFSWAAKRNERRRRREAKRQKEAA